MSWIIKAVPPGGRGRVGNGEEEEEE